MKYDIIKLGSLVSVKGGKRLPKGKNLIKIHNNHPYIRVRDLNGKRLLELNNDFEYVDYETQKSISKYIVDKRDIIISIVGTIGLVSIIGESLDKANLTENCVKLTEISGIDRDYLYYYLVSDKGQNEILRGTVGAVQAKLPIKNIQDIDVLLPSIDNQKKIAAILSAIDDKIELNQKINKNLEAQAQAIFKSWFVDFEPFGGIMPDDWRIETLDKVADMVAGGDKPDNVSEFATKECPYPIYSNGISNEGLYGYTDVAKIHKESVTVSARGTIGYVCLRHLPYVPIVRLITLIPNCNLISAKYLYLYLKQLHIIGTGTTQQQLTVPTFKRTEIIVPTKEICYKLTQTVNPLFEKIWLNQAENQRLSALRDTLLPKLMSGELDVSEIEL